MRIQASRIDRIDILCQFEAKPQAAIMDTKQLSAQQRTECVGKLLAVLNEYSTKEATDALKMVGALYNQKVVSMFSMPMASQPARARQNRPRKDPGKKPENRDPEVLRIQGLLKANQEAIREKVADMKDEPKVLPHSDALLTERNRLLGDLQSRKKELRAPKPTKVGAAKEEADVSSASSSTSSAGSASQTGV